MGGLGIDTTSKTVRRFGIELLTAAVRTIFHSKFILRGNEVGRKNFKKNAGYPGTRVPGKKTGTRQKNGYPAKKRVPGKKRVTGDPVVEMALRGG